MLLFVFSVTFFDKIADYNSFIHQLFLSPLIPANYLHPVGIMVMLMECIAIFFLLNTHYLHLGFLLSSFLLSLFGTYLWFLITFFSFSKPCGCGFIFGFLNYNEHIWVNFLLSGISALGFYYLARSTSNLSSTEMPNAALEN